jgi:hypothetical protein
MYNEPMLRDDALSGKTIIVTGGGTGFIPFKISITLDGISGFKIYQKLQVNTRFLPAGYAESIDFIITGVDHKLKDNDWETEVKCVMIPKFEEYTQIITTDLYSYVKSQPPKPITSPSGPAATNNADNTSAWSDKVVKAGQEVFPNISTSGERGACAKWTADLAQHLINIIIDSGLAPGKSKIGTGGNWGHAWDANFSKNAINTGFYELKQSWTLADNTALTPSETKTLLNQTINPNAEYGDIVQYYVSDGTVGGNTRGVDRPPGEPVYHTEIYTGKLAQGIKDGSGIGIGIGWSSSWPGNYGGAFVYSSRPYLADDKFEIYWLRVKDEYRK